MSTNPNVAMDSRPAISDLVIVGGGAAGFFAATACAEQARAAGQPLYSLILEKAGRPLGKVRISGGGRCNLTHACYEPARLVEHYPRGGRALLGAFTRFQPRDTVAWFEKRGVDLKTEPDGRIFPRSDSSQTIIHCLMEAARQAGIELWTRVTVVSIERSAETGGQFRVRLRSGDRGGNGGVTYPESLHSRTVLLATGGDPGMLSLATNLGHTCVPPAPSLFTFTVADPRLAGLAGISVPVARVSLATRTASAARQQELNQEGALLITHWGFSGPVVLRLSAWGARWLFENHYQAELRINWLAPIHCEGALTDLLEYKKSAANARQKAASHDPFQRLPLRLWKRLAAAAGISDQQNWGDCSKSTLRRLAEELTQGLFWMQGKGPYKEEFVTCGGIPLEEVNLKTMESRLVPGLYFAGEVLDVDGLTGGFNFQNAWTTGWIAGTTIASRLAPGSSSARSGFQLPPEI